MILSSNNNIGVDDETSMRKINYLGHVWHLVLNMYITQSMPTWAMDEHDVFSFSLIFN